MDGFEQAQRELLNSKGELEALIAARAAEDNNTFTRTSRRRLEAIGLWKKAKQAWELVLMWLEFRKEHFAFLIDFDIPFPKKFLDKDACYFICRLDRNSFDCVRLKAVCASDSAAEMFEEDSEQEGEEEEGVGRVFTSEDEEY